MIQKNFKRISVDENLATLQKTHRQNVRQLLENLDDEEAAKQLFSVIKEDFDEIVTYARAERIQQIIGSVDAESTVGKTLHIRYRRYQFTESLRPVVDAHFHVEAQVCLEAEPQSPNKLVRKAKANAKTDDGGMLFRRHKHTRTASSKPVGNEPLKTARIDARKLLRNTLSDSSSVAASTRQGSIFSEERSRVTTTSARKSNHGKSYEEPSDTEADSEQSASSAENSEEKDSSSDSEDEDSSSDSSSDS